MFHHRAEVRLFALRLARCIQEKEYVLDTSKERADRDWWFGMDADSIRQKTISGSSSQKSQTTKGGATKSSVHSSLTISVPVFFSTNSDSCATTKLVTVTASESDGVEAESDGNTKDVASDQLPTHYSTYASQRIEVVWNADSKDTVTSSNTKKEATKPSSSDSESLLQQHLSLQTSLADFDDARGVTASSGRTAKNGYLCPTFSEYWTFTAATSQKLKLLQNIASSIGCFFGDRRLLVLGGAVSKIPTQTSSIQKETPSCSEGDGLPSTSCRGGGNSQLELGVGNSQQLGNTGGVFSLLPADLFLPLPNSVRFDQDAQSQSVVLGGTGEEKCGSIRV